jgi:serine/threonine protein kinase
VEADTQVFEAVGLAGHRGRVAIKHYRPAPPFDEQSVSRAAMRARAACDVAQAVDHPAFPRIHEVIDGVYTVMDWADGCALSEFVARRRMSESEAVSIGLQIAVACGFLSKALARRFPDAPDMGHGDLHWENILIDDASGTPDVRIVDYDQVGLRLRGAAKWQPDLIAQARAADRDIVQSPEYILGSVRYMDSRADIFSLGAILYRLFSGRSPFRQSAGYVAKLQRFYEGDLRPDEDVCAFAVGDIANVKMRGLLTRMLSFDRTRRPRSMDEVADALRSIAFDEEGRS